MNPWRTFRHRKMKACHLQDLDYKRVRYVPRWIFESRPAILRARLWIPKAARAIFENLPRAFELTAGYALRRDSEISKLRFRGARQTLGVYLDPLTFNFEPRLFARERRLVASRSDKGG